MSSRRLPKCAHTQSRGVASGVWLSNENTTLFRCTYCGVCTHTHTNKFTLTNTNIHKSRVECAYCLVYILLYYIELELHSSDLHTQNYTIMIIIIIIYCIDYRDRNNIIARKRKAPTTGHLYVYINIHIFYTSSARTIARGGISVYSHCFSWRRRPLAHLTDLSKSSSILK